MDLLYFCESHKWKATFIVICLFKDVSNENIWSWNTDPISSSRAKCVFPYVTVKVTQSCQTRCDPMDYTVHGILQARILEWIAFPISRGSSQPRDQTQVSCITGGFFTSWATREASAMTTRISWQRRQWQPTPVLSLGKSHGRRSLLGCSPCSCEELDTTE